MHFVGVELARSPGDASGGAVLSADGGLLCATGTLGDDRDVLDFVSGAVPQGISGLVAIDASLVAPDAAGSRPCDRELRSVLARFCAGPDSASQHEPAPGGGPRGQAIAKGLDHLTFGRNPFFCSSATPRQVIEVRPLPSAASLLNLDQVLRYRYHRNRDYALRWSELGRLRDGLAALAESDPPLRLPADVAAMRIEGRRGTAFKEAQDLLEAIVCAYSALYAWFHGPRGYAVYGRGSPDDAPSAGSNGQGHVLVPMTREMWERTRTGRLLLLDRDGTLNESLGRRPPNHPDEVKLLPGVGATLHWYASMGWRVIVITNQGGVAFGYQTEEQARAVQQRVLDVLPVAVEASFLCPHHPDGTVPQYAITCPNRKPNPGAIRKALARFNARAGDCLFVGDQETDRLAAAAGGVPFAWAPAFFRWKSPRSGVLSMK